MNLPLNFPKTKAWWTIQYSTTRYKSHLGTYSKWPYRWYAGMVGQHQSTHSVRWLDV